MQLFEDGVSCSGPLEGLAVGVVGGDEMIDALHELLDAGGMKCKCQRGRAASHALIFGWLWVA